MADIKSGVVAEKTLSLNEKPLVESEKLKQSLEHISDGEKINSQEKNKQNIVSEIVQAKNQTAVAVNPAVGIMAPTAKRQKQVENVLAKDMADIYLSLTPQKRREFKISGEQTANKINKLLNKTKIDIGEIIKLIKKWLSLIPGINKYFLEKEAKIKADELVKLKN